tara:strand:- start:228 stop:386 length:159 start_codon:yes stop_codon:yes gene_type:complete
VTTQGIVVVSKMRRGRNELTLSILPLISPPTLLPLQLPMLRLVVVVLARRKS